MLILLVGPKGSGKSHIGRILESSFGIRFFHVEPLWMAYYEECARAELERNIAEGIRRVHPAIDEALARHPYVCVETTGASREILEDLLRLGDRHGLMLVRVRASLDLCLERIAARDQTNQIAMDEASIRTVYQLGSELELDWTLTLDNEGLSDDEIVEAFAAVLSP